MDNVFLGCPTHNGLLDYRTARSIYSTASKERSLQIVVQQSSLLAMSCNQLWCLALNSRTKNNLKWFAMLHADVVPEAWWLDKMIAIAEEYSADLLSAIVPIKDASGVTSTAIAQWDSPYGCQARLTQTQINHPDFPETFDKWALHEAMSKLPPELNIDKAGDLLVNTGCMICRIDQLWSDEVFFTINDRIDQKFNQYYTEVQPEDWFFSKKVYEAGGKVMATRAVTVQHIGNTAYNSAAVWGSNVDPNYIRR